MYLLSPKKVRGQIDTFEEIYYTKAFSILLIL